jgi:hypothetical protein
MMLIGTSLGGCLKSILAGEVSEDDVLIIITRTDCKDLEGLLTIAERYYREGNSYARRPSNYSFDSENTTLEDVKALAARLYLQGKIHQPRNYGHDTGFIHGSMSRMSLWMEVSPIGLNDNPAVIEAYEKYKVLDNLTK